MLTTEQINEIEARASAATEGPWSDFCESGDWWIERADSEGNPIDDHGRRFWIDADTMDSATMVFIAASRTDIPALVAHCRALEARLQTLMVCSACQKCDRCFVTLFEKEAVFAAPTRAGDGEG